MRWSTVGLAASVLNLSALLACSAGYEPLIEIGQLTAPAVVDFGTVDLGTTVTSSLPVTNPGDVPLRVLRVDAMTDLTDDAFGFVVPRDGFIVPARSTVGLPVSFVARSTTLDPEGYSTTLELTTEFYEPEPPHSTIRLQVLLRGRPMPPGLEISPNPVDFGRVFRGSDKTIDITVRNVTDVPIEVWGDVDDGRIRWLPAAAGVFAIEPAPGADGKLGSTKLPPGGTLPLRAVYRPAADAPESIQRAGWYLRNCEDPLCRVLLRFQGQSTSTPLICEPPAVTFGRVNPEQRAVREIVCTNSLSDPLSVRSVTVDGPSTFSTDVPFGVPQQIPANGTMVLTVAYTPTERTLGQTEAATVRIEAVDPSGQAVAPVEIPATGLAGGPRIEIEPIPLDFGLVAVGVPLTRALVVRNVGYEPLVLNELRLQGPDAGAFTFDATAFSLAPRESRVLAVTFDPTEEGRNTATVTFVSNDEQTPELAVPLVGQAERVLPCQYTLAPESIDFGPTFVTTQRVQAIEFRNTGTDACILNGFDIQYDGEGDSPFDLLEPPAAGIRIAAGGIFSLRVRYRPMAEGVDRGLVTVRVSDPAEPVAGVPLAGRAEALIDVGCPPPQTTPAGTAVQLTAGTADANRYEWRLISSPNGGGNTPDLWNPDPPNARTVRFLPFIVGLYVLELTVETSGGQTLSCQTEVTAAGQGLRVTLTWDGPGDVDLHVHNGDTSGGAWFTPNDCYFSNRTPLWFGVEGDQGQGPNPELDFDNVVADGPENTSIDAPEFNRTYHVAVHNFTRAAGRRARIEIFCGGTAVPDASFLSNRLQGTERSTCTSNNTFWRVATVRFTQPGVCVIQPVDTYSTAREACTSL